VEVWAVVIQASLSQLEEAVLEVCPVARAEEEASQVVEGSHFKE
jgi:hypothetical protein